MPVNIKFCFDIEWVKSVIALNFIKDVKSYAELDEATLREYFDYESRESKGILSLNTLYEIENK